MANKPSAVLWPQMAGVTFTYMITPLVASLIAVAGETVFNQPIGSPLDALSYKLDQESYHNPATRAGVFFIGLSFAVVTLGVNVSANSLSTGSDLMALCPRYINIRRGQIVALIIGAVYNPWIVLNSSSNFTTYISSFAVFLSSCAGIQVADYYFVSRGAVHVPSLYHRTLANGTPSRYQYCAGISLRAYAAYFAGVAVNLPGYVGECRGGNFVSRGIQNEFTIAYLVGFGVSFTLYLLLHAPLFWSHYQAGASLGWYEPLSGTWEAHDWDAPLHTIVSDPGVGTEELPAAGPGNGVLVPTITAPGSTYPEHASGVSTKDEDVNQKEKARPHVETLLY